jgi:hypothetical protein
LDAADYKLPENSGSAFFTYGFAYRINSGILERAKYQHVVQKAWQGLLSHIYQDGRLGCIQPVGAAPGDFTAASSYVFGTRAFLPVGLRSLQAGALNDYHHAPKGEARRVASSAEHSSRCHGARVHAPERAKF